MSRTNTKWVSVLVSLLAVCAAACTQSDECVPLEKLFQRSPELQSRLEKAAKSEIAQGRPQAKMGDFDCSFNVGYPTSPTGEGDPSTPGTWATKKISLLLGLSAEQVAHCSSLSVAPDPKTFFNCVTVSLIVGGLNKDKTTWLLAFGLNTNQVQRAKMSPAGMECTAKTVRVLARDTTWDALAAGALLVEFLLNAAGTALVPAPAAIPVLYGGPKDACLDMPPEPEKRCTDTSGCPDKPSGAEEPSASTGSGGTVPPGTDPTPLPDPGDHL